MDEEAKFARSVGLSFGALWIAVIALQALTFTAPTAVTPTPDTLFARAGDGPLPMARPD